MPPGSPNPDPIALMRDDVMISLVTSKRVLVVMFRGEFEKKYGRETFLSRHREIRENGSPVLTSQPTIPRLPPCAVLYRTGSEISRICRPQNRGRKIDREIIFSIFIREQHEDSIKQIKKSVIYTLRPQWSKSIPIFRPKRLKNHTLWGGTYLYSLYRGVLPPPPPPGM